MPADINYLLFLASFSTVRVTHYQSKAAFHIETGHLLCTVNHVTGFYMKYQTALKHPVSSSNFDKSATFNPANKYMNKLIKQDTEN